MGYRILLLVVLAGVCFAKGGGFGGRAGGFSSGSRGFSAARSSVSSGGGSFHSSSASGASGRSSTGIGSPGRASFSSAAKGAAIGGAAGFVGGMAVHSMISSHIPITMNHRSYYWSNNYSYSHKKNMEKCSLNLTDDPIFSELEFDNSTDNSTYPDAVIWECPMGRCDMENMGCIENDKSILIIVVVVIISVLALTIFFILFGRWKKRCAQHCNEAQRRREYEVSCNSAGGGGGPTDGMAPLPRTPISRSPARRPYSAKI